MKKVLLSGFLLFVLLFPAQSWIGPAWGKAPDYLRATIYEIQYTGDPGDGTYPSPYYNQYVATSGVVVAVYPSYYGGAYVIEDPAGGPWSGIMVFDSCHKPAVGDALELVALVDEYYGFTELKSIRAYTVTASGQPLPPAVLTDTAHLSTANPAWAEALESVLVRVEWVTVTNPNLGYGEWEINDGSGPARVDDVAGYAYTPHLNDVLEAITGTLWYTYNDYKVEPRSDADIVLHDETPPFLLSTVPAPGATGVSLYEPLRATFSEDIRPETLNWVLVGPTGFLSATVAYDASTYRATLTPADFLEAYTRYTSTIAGSLEDLRGNPMGADYTWSFTTGEADTQPPRVYRIYPPSGAAGVSIYTSVLITFTEAMDPATINPNTVLLLRGGTTPVAGRVSYDPARFRATFTPQLLLEENTFYQAKVSQDVADRAGNRLGYDHTWTFRTGAAPAFSCYHGDLHNHTSYSDGALTPTVALATGRANGLDFMAITDHSYAVDDAEWEDTLAAVQAATVPGEFVAIRGAEWTQGSEGHINVYNTVRHPTRSNMGYAYGDYVPGLEDGVTVIGFYTWMVHTGTQAVDDTGTLAQFNHPGWMNFNDWAYHPEALDLLPLAEMGNGYGASYVWSEEQSLRALDYGWRVAPTDNADMHSPEWGAYPIRTGIWATELTKAGVMEALRARRTFATEDVNYELAFKANGYWMGSEIPNAGTISFQVTGHDPDGEGGALVELVSDMGRVLLSTTVDADFTWTPSLAIAPGVHYYYIRVTQSDGDRIASAPVWTEGDEDVSITDFTIQPSIPTTSTASLLTARVTNRGIADLQGITVTFAAEGVPFAQVQVDVPRDGDAFAYASWRPEQAGPVRVAVSLDGVPAGDNPDDNAAEMLLEVTGQEIPLIMIDAGHKNKNVGAPMAHFLADLSAHHYNVLYNLDEITAEELEPVRLLIVTDPGDDPDNPYNVTETQAIAQYVAAGGALWLAGEADYKNQGNSDELNSLLAAIEAAAGEEIPARFNDDEVIDGDDNNGYPWGVTWHIFLTDTVFSTGVGVNVTATASWSECSLTDRNHDALTPEDGALLLTTGDLDPGMCETRYGPRPCRTYNEDASGDCSEDHDLAYIYPLTGTIPVPLAALYELSSGGRIALWADSNDTFSTYGYTAGDHKQNELLNLELVMWLLGDPLQKWPIARARMDLDGDDVPDYRGRLVWVEGTVTAAFGEFFDVLYVQDESGGITVYAPAGDIEGEFQRGALVRVVATVDVYQGDTELQFAEAEQIRILGQGMVPEPRVLSTGEAAGEESEGWLLQTEGLVTAWYDAQSFIINDGSGPCRIFLDGYNNDPANPTFENIQVGNWVRAIGLGSEDYGGQRIRVRAESDIVVLEHFWYVYLPLVFR